MTSTNPVLKEGAILFLTTLIFVSLPNVILLSLAPSSIFVEARTSTRTEE